MNLADYLNAVERLAFAGFLVLILLLLVFRKPRSALIGLSLLLAGWAGARQFGITVPNLLHGPYVANTAYAAKAPAPDDDSPVTRVARQLAEDLNSSGGGFRSSQPHGVQVPGTLSFTIALGAIFDPALGTSVDVIDVMRARLEALGTDAPAAPRVFAELEADQFDVKLLSKDGRPVLDLNNHETWIWSVVPKTSGSQRLRMTFYVSVDGQTFHKSRSFEVEHTVETSGLGGVFRAANEAPPWIGGAGALLCALLAFLLPRRRKAAAG